MSLTKGQKEALQRQVQKIINEKRNALIEKFKKEWKPKDRATGDRLLAVKTACKLYDDFRKKAAEAGFNITYRGFEVELEGINCSLCSDFNSNSYDNIVEQLQACYANDKLDVKAFPGIYDIEDEIELASIDKSFDVEAFLEKYKNL